MKWPQEADPGGREQTSGWPGPRGPGRAWGGPGATVNGQRASTCGAQHVLNLWLWLHDFVNMLKTTELHTLKWPTSCHVNCRQ